MSYTSAYTGAQIDAGIAKTAKQTITTNLTVQTGNVTLNGNVDNTSSITIGSGAVSVAGSNTGDQTTVSGSSGSVKSNATTGVMQIVGPTGGSTRVMTTPDANFTVARTDAGQTFTGAQVFSSTVEIDGGSIAINNGSSSYFSQIKTEYNYPYMDAFFDAIAGSSYEGRLRFRTSSGGGAATVQMTVDNSGNLTITGSTATKASGTTWANPSDQRIKDNITEYNKGLDELAQINVKEWEYNGKGGSSAGMKGIGVIADEVEKILPETVTTYKAKLNPEDEQETDIKQFDASEVVWLLVKSVQQLKAKIEALEASK